MTQIYLIRHAQAEGNLYRRAHGSYDSLITPQGYRQIAALRERFKDIHIDAVYASPRFRTCTTAGAIYVPKHLPLRILDGLREIGCGVWEDRTWGEIRYTEPEELEHFNFHIDLWRTEGAERAEDVLSRMMASLKTIAEECEGQTVAAVSHGMASRLLLGTLSGLRIDEISENFPHGDNTSVSLLEYENGHFRIVFSNDTSHLGEGLSTFSKQSWWKGRGFEEIGLRFLPLNLENRADASLYRLCRAEAWQSSHGTMAHYDGDAFLSAARANVVLAAYHKDSFAGLLQLDTQWDAECGAGRVPFVYMSPDYRRKGVGIQLIGEAISRFRTLGRSCIRLRCAEENAAAQRFYERIGFRKRGAACTQPVALSLMELPITASEVSNMAE